MSLNVAHFSAGSADDDTAEVKERPWARGTIALRVIAAVSLVLAAAATWANGAPPPWTLIGIMTLLAAIAALRADSALAGLPMLLVIWWWSVADVDPWGVGGPLAVALLLMSHITLTLAALTPHSATPDRAVVLMWSRRGAYLLSLTAGMYALAWLLADRPVSGVVALAGVVAALILTLAIALAFPSQAYESVGKARRRARKDVRDRRVDSRPF